MHMRKIPFDRETAKLFADETRVKILELLAEEGEMTNSQLARRLNLAKGTITHHLKLLEDAGIVYIGRIEPETHGIPMKFYRLKVELVPFKASQPVKYAPFKEGLKKEVEEALSGKVRGGEVSAAMLRIIKSVTQIMGEEGESILYSIGYDIGRESIAGSIKSADMEGILDEIAKLWSEFHLGIMKVAENGKVVKIRVFECFDCGGLPDVGKTFCFFDTGIIAGVLDSKLGGKHSVEEVKCSGTGYEYCEFEIKRME